MKKPLHRRYAAMCFAAVAVMGMAGCSSGGSSESSPASSAAPAAVDPAAVALLPADLKKGGTLTVGAEVGGPPGQYFEPDGSTVTGFGHDIGEGIASRLGLKLTWENMSFDGLIPALKANRVDLVISSMSDTVERQKVLSFVDYFTESTGLMVQAGNPAKINSLADVCGRKVAVKPGTSAVKLADEQNTKCTAEGKPSVEIVQLPSNSAIILQLKSGGVDVMLDDASGLGYVAETTGGGKVFEVVNTPEKYQAGPLGIGLAPDRTDLAKAIQAALDAMIKDGSYGKILDQYGVSNGAVKSATINAGPS